MSDRRRPLTKKEKAAICLRQGGRCKICSEHLQPGQIRYDHFNPRYFTGSDHVDEFQALCLTCDDIKTNGRPATTLGSDKHTIAKDRRLAKRKNPGGKSAKRKTKWPQGRKIQSRPMRSKA